VQSASGVSVDELARGGGFRHGWISIATIAELRWLGCEVVCPTPGKGLYHATYMLWYEQD
jgi:hypothetical protein